MVSDTWANRNETLEFREIILTHLKRILEISSHELRNTSREVVTSNSVLKIEEEDTRLSYVQAVENLSYVLVGHFDDEIKKVYKEYISIITGFDYEVMSKLKEIYDETCKQTGREVIIKGFVLEMKIRYAKKLFCELNLLLKRVDYLSSAVYGEDSSDIVEADDLEGDIEQ
jgi:hypothetical protein